MSTAHDEPGPFRYGAEVGHGEVHHIHYDVGETYLGRPVEIPVTIVNGEHAGPRNCPSAAMHGDEVSGVKILQEVADRYDPADLHGTIVCLHVVNVPGYIAQQRRLPLYDRDLNRSFPGTSSGLTASRMARITWDRFVGKCNIGLKFHTSTRNRVSTFAKPTLTSGSPGTAPSTG